MPDEIRDKIIEIAEIYNADIEITDNIAVIIYPNIGEGTHITGMLEDAIGDDIGYRIKMYPSDCKLEFELVK